MFRTFLWGIIFPIILGIFFIRFTNFHHSRLELTHSNQDLDLYNTISWENEKGEVATIHHMNPTRAEYIETLIQDIHNSKSSKKNKIIKVLDFGCGSGVLLFELMRRITTFRVEFVCVDIAHVAIENASKRRDSLIEAWTRDLKKLDQQIDEFINQNEGEEINESSGQNAELRQVNKELLARRDALGIMLDNLDKTEFLIASQKDLKKQIEQYDLIIASNVLNYVFDLREAFTIFEFILKPNGIFYFDNINRNFVSLLITHFVQYFKWIPRNTFDWRMFITPNEIQYLLGENSLNLSNIKSIVPNFTLSSFIQFLKESFNGNYIAHFDMYIVNKLPQIIDFMYIGHARKV